MSMYENKMTFPLPDRSDKACLVIHQKTKDILPLTEQNKPDLQYIFQTLEGAEKYAKHLADCHPEEAYVVAEIKIIWMFKSKTTTKIEQFSWFLDKWCPS